MEPTKQMNFELKNFFRILYKDTKSIAECEENMSQAIKSVSGLFRIGKAEMTIETPASKLRPDGEKRQVVLFNGDNVNTSAPCEFVYASPDEGRMTITVFPDGAESFTADEKEALSLLLAAMYYCWSSTTTHQLLGRVLSTDLQTGVATFEALMRYFGMLIAKGELVNYHALFFNIHNFKYVNKVFPYEQGDIVLRKYAQTAASLLRPDEMIARLGGDNFVMLIGKEHDDEIIFTLQNMKISHSFMGKDKTFAFGITGGVASLQGIQRPAEIMARVAVAFQASRANRAGTVSVYSEEMRKTIMERQSVISNFFPAMQSGEFLVYYQPKVSISGRKICGAEALARWNRGGSLVSPASFIPVLEQEGSICALDYYVLESVCRYLKNRLKLGKEAVTISVNFSRRHLEEEDLLQNIISVIDRYGIDHSYIEIELTESEDFQDFERITTLVNGLKSQGIGTSMDDFGTGYSSLNMIKKVDLDVIKIDRSFIPLASDYPGKDKDLILFKHVIELVKQLGKKTVAEGVETTEQLAYLEKAGCDIIQGYVFDKPLSEADFDERMEKGYNEEELNHIG